MTSPLNEEVRSLDAAFIRDTRGGVPTALPNRLTVQADRFLETLRRAVPLLRSDYILEPLDPQATYAVQDLDAPETNLKVSGQELLERGLPVRIEKQPGSSLVVYQKK